LILKVGERPASQEATRRREDAASTWLTEQHPSSLIACPRPFEQPDANVDAEAGEIRRAFSQPCREIDHFDRGGERRDFDLERDPSCATSIYSGDKHKKGFTHQSIVSEVFLDDPLPPRQSVATAHAEDYGSSGKFFSSDIGEIESFT
jgi:hypothetical protein